jgi:hypothetical protein
MFNNLFENNVYVQRETVIGEKCEINYFSLPGRLEEEKE